MGRLEPSFQIQAPIQTQLPASKVSSGRCYLNGPLAADGAATSPSVFLDVFHLAAAAAVSCVISTHRIHPHLSSSPERFGQLVLMDCVRFPAFRPATPPAYKYKLDFNFYCTLTYLWFHGGCYDSLPTPRSAPLPR